MLILPVMVLFLQILLLLVLAHMGFEVPERESLASSTLLHAFHHFGKVQHLLRSLSIYFGKQSD